MKKEEKKKISIDFLPETYLLLRDYSNQTDTSNSTIVNKVLQTILPLSDEIRGELRDYCFERMMELENTLINVGSFESQDYLVRISQWKQLGAYFNETTSEDIPSPKMKWRKLKNGYCKYPTDWIELTDVMGKDGDCEFAGVVECRNGAKHGINGNPVPHFIFFCDTKYARDYSDELYLRVYEACTKVYPDFNRLISIQPTKKDWEKTKLNDAESLERVRELNELPQIGLFNIPVQGDPFYWNPSSPNYQPPFGAVVIHEDRS